MVVVDGTVIVVVVVVVGGVDSGDDDVDDDNADDDDDGVLSIIGNKCVFSNGQQPCSAGPNKASNLTRFNKSIHKSTTRPTVLCLTGFRPFR